MGKLSEIRDSNKIDEARYKGIYTALTDYINDSQLADETPLTLFELMSYYSVTQENILIYRIDAAVPFLMGAKFFRDEITGIIELAIQKEKDLKRNGKFTLLIDTYRLNHILNLCTQADGKGKVFKKDIEQVKKDKCIIHSHKAEQEKQRELINCGFIKPSDEPSNGDTETQKNKQPSSKTTNKQEEVIAALALLYLKGQHIEAPDKGHYAAAETLIQAFQLSLPSYGVNKTVVSQEKLANYIKNGLNRLKD